MLLNHVSCALPVLYLEIKEWWKDPGSLWSPGLHKVHRIHAAHPYTFVVFGIGCSKCHYTIITPVSMLNLQLNTYKAIWFWTNFQLSKGGLLVARALPVRCVDKDDVLVHCLEPQSKWSSWHTAFQANDCVRDMKYAVSGWRRIKLMANCMSLSAWLGALTIQQQTRCFLVGRRSLLGSSGSMLEALVSYNITLICYCIVSQPSIRAERDMNL